MKKNIKKIKNILLNNNYLNDENNMNINSLCMQRNITNKKKVIYY